VPHVITNHHALHAAFNTTDNLSMETVNVSTAMNPSVTKKCVPQNPMFYSSLFPQSAVSFASP
jgi:hypothetical protein